MHESIIAFLRHVVHCFVSFTEKIPLMKPGHTVRNLLITGFVIFLFMGIAIGGGDDTNPPPGGLEENGGNSEAINEDPETKADSDDSDSTETATSEPETGTSSDSGDEVDTPDDTKDTESDNSAELGPEHFELVLRAQFDGEVISYQETGGNGELVVISHSDGNQDALLREMGQVAGTYAAYVSDENVNDPPERLLITVVARDGKTVAGWYYIDTEWSMAYMNGEITAEEYSLLVMNTVEANDD